MTPHGLRAFLLACLAVLSLAAEPLQRRDPITLESGEVVLFFADAGDRIIVLDSRGSRTVLKADLPEAVQARFQPTPEPAPPVESPPVDRERLTNLFPPRPAIPFDPLGTRGFLPREGTVGDVWVEVWHVSVLHERESETKLSKRLMESEDALKARLARIPDGGFLILRLSAYFSGSADVNSNAFTVILLDEYDEVVYRFRASSSAAPIRNGSAWRNFVFVALPDLSAHPVIRLRVVGHREQTHADFLSNPEISRRAVRPLWAP